MLLAGQRGARMAEMQCQVESSELQRDWKWNMMETEAAYLQGPNKERDEQSLWFFQQQLCL